MELDRDPFTKAVRSDREGIESGTDELAVRFQAAVHEGEKRKILEMLWFAVEQRIKTFIRTKNNNEVNDVLHDFYVKFAYVASKWRKEGGSFISYCLTAVRNMLTNNFRKRAKTQQDLEYRDEVLVEGPNSEKDISIEDRIFINKIKLNLINWIDSGLLTIEEGLVLVLRFGLGKALAKGLVSRFKRKDRRLRNVDLEKTDFDQEMIQVEIAEVLENTQGQIPKIVSRAISKIKTELDLK